MEHKRITLFAGHYGSGKTSIAVSYALKLKETCPYVTVADLDIVNPYFRTKDSADILLQNGIPLISSPFANSNVDLPALPSEMYAITEEKHKNYVVDVGGDDRGALALGRLKDDILEENNYEMLLVINRYRPLTATPEETLEVLREIEQACGIPCTHIVNNSNIGRETTAEEVLASIEYAKAVSNLTGLPMKMTTVREDLFEEVKQSLPNAFPIRCDNYKNKTGNSPRKDEQKWLK